MTIYELFKNIDLNKYNPYFIQAFEKLINYEGIYSWYSNDNGGETIFGIARNFNSNWKGFQILDKIKEKLNLKDKDLIDNPKNMKKIDQYIQNNLNNIDIKKLLVKTIQYYYDLFKKYKLEYFNELGVEIFDTGVNQGFKRAIITLQKTLNLLNRNQKDFKDLVLDGIIGSKTINAYKILKNQGISDIVKTVYKLYKGKFYIDLMEKNRAKYSIFRGWFRRI